jgi:cytochrome c peroxidase
MAIVLGKAFFWDKQAGSDGQACASCHFQAGADTRDTNSLDPGRRFEPSDFTFQQTRTGGRGPNYKLKAGDFPFHVLADPKDRNSAVVFDSNDIGSSTGTFGGDLQEINNAIEKCKLDKPDPNGFNKDGNRVRRVPPRNTPTNINAIFQFRTFWDGRANNHFNGRTPLGQRDPLQRVLAVVGNTVVDEKLDLENAALASQATGPLLNDTEMSCNLRSFDQVANKLYNQTTPLAHQKVDKTDSVLGVYANPSGDGLKSGVTYPGMIRDAFQPKYWVGGANMSSDVMIAKNFSMFWGLAIMMYESTLVSDQTPFDAYITKTNEAALTPLQVKGLGIFQSGKGKCAECHKGPDFTAAGFNLQASQTANASERLTKQMSMGDGSVAIYDNGFYNIGVTPTTNDLGLGGAAGVGTLAFSRQFKQVGPVSADGLRVSPCKPGEACNTSSTQRDAVDGTFKVPSLRNVELTGPYMHNGSMATLEQVVEFYSRGGNNRGTDTANTTGFGPNASNLDKNIQNISFGAEDQAALVAFLKSLTDDRVRCEKAPFDHPSLPTYNGHTTSATDGRLGDVFMDVPAVGAAGRPAGTCLAGFLK